MTVRRRKVPDPGNRKVLVAAYKQARTFIRKSGKAKTATTKATAEAKARTNANAAANELLAKNRNTFIKGYSNLKTPTRLHMSPAKRQALKNKLSDFKQEIARGKAAEKAAEKATAAKATAEKKEAAAKAKEAANKKATEAKAAEEAANTTLQNVKNLNSSTAAFSLNAARQALSAYNIRHAKLIRFGRKKPEPAAVTSLRSKLKAANTTKSNAARAAALHELQTYAKGTNVETEQLKRLLSAYNRAGTKGQKNNNGVNEIRQKIKIAGVKELPPISAWLKTHTNRSGNSKDNVSAVMIKLLNAYKAAHPYEANIVAPKNVKDLRRRMKAVTNKKAKAARIEGISGANKIGKLNRLRIALGRNKELKNARNASNTAAAARRMAEIAQFKTNLNRTNYEVTPAIRTQIAQLKNKNLSKKLANFNRTQNQSRVHLMTLLEGTEPLSLKNRLDIRRRVKNDKLQNALKKFNKAAEIQKFKNLLANTTTKRVGPFNRHRIAQLGNNNLTAKLAAFNEAKAKKNTTLAALKTAAAAINFKNNADIARARSLLDAYNKAHKGRPGWSNNKKVQEIRSQLKKINNNAARQSNASRQRLMGLLTSKPLTPLSLKNRLDIRRRVKNDKLQTKLKEFNDEMKTSASPNQPPGKGIGARLRSVNLFGTRAKAEAVAAKKATENAAAKNNALAHIRGLTDLLEKNPNSSIFVRNAEKALRNYNESNTNNNEHANVTALRAKLKHITGQPHKRPARPVQPPPPTPTKGFLGRMGNRLRPKPVNANAAAANRVLINDMAKIRKVNETTLKNAKAAYEAYRLAHRYQLPFKNAQEYKNLGQRIRNYESTQVPPRKGFLAGMFTRQPQTFNNSKLRNALQKHLSGTQEIYNKAVIRAILAHTNIQLTPNQRNQLQRKLQTRAGRFAGALGRGALTAGGALAAGTMIVVPAILSGLAKGGRMTIAQLKQVIANPRATQEQKVAAAIAAGLFKRVGSYGEPIPYGYVLKSGNSTIGSFGLGYYRNNKAIESQIKYRTNKPSGVSVGVGPNRYGYGYRPNGYGNRYNNYYGYGPRRNNRGGPAAGPSAPAGGIVFAPKINVGAARIGAQTFGGTRVGGQQMGGSRVRTGNAGSTTLKTGNTGGVQVSNVGKVSNAGKANVGTRPTNTGLTVSAPTSNGSRQLAATPEQLIRGAGGAEAIEKGVQALNAANGNVARARAASKLPNNTFTNIYALGGPVAAKKAVALRRRSRASKKKKHVVHKAKKQYIKLTPYQFRRLTDHIKKNNLRKVLIKEITH